MLVSAPPDLLAHGLGGRTDLPLDAGAALAGGAVAVAVALLALAALRPRPWLDPERGRALPALTRVVDHPALRATARGLVLALTLLVAVVGLFGPPTTEDNLAPWVLYVVFWVGLAVVSPLLGPVWRAVNPVRTLARLLRLSAGSRRLPARLGYLPAAAWLTGFVWLELVAPDRAVLLLVGALVLGYLAVALALVAVYGEEWFARGDGFEVLSTQLARLAPVARRDGVLALRNPLAGLVTAETERSGARPDDADPVPHLAAVLVVLLGSTGFDGLSRTSWWAPYGESVAAGTLGLAASILAVGVLYAVAVRATAWASGSVPRAGRARPSFAATLIPIALGYTVAHYFSFLLVEGQTAAILASDPFGTGLDLFGTAERTVDLRVVSPTVVAAVQVNAIVLGHVAATVAGHDLALRQGGDRARWGQVPLVLAMIVLTCAALGLLLSG
ncbi:MAG: hypothetical protein AVDCRST_MAG54-4712 [uncultured Actinomycetospora sp.]|uniref:Fenitrothion hydrolase n=1 Tax=uncultured Actinomycetospora sp. TaxID=1135996 RepID=A0A6J4K2L2_9PSEU|nr:MAG: hypothetical protein AVDCRST_MAG54-4712 [uncultured Actinomycetospora sp.]